MQNSQPARQIASWLPALLIPAASLLLLANCWDSQFLPYDDDTHIHRNPQLRQPFFELFKTPEYSTYIPITIISYKFDVFVFGDWFVSMWNTWAPAVRLMTWLYHVVAALALWRVLMLIGLPRIAASFVALIFSVHPMACETICWASERKNALAAMFGFGMLLMWLKFQDRYWRVPVCAVLYILACLSKPAALGLLPVLAFVELFGGRDGLNGEAPLQWRPSREWPRIAEQMLPFALISTFVIYMNIIGHKKTLVEPPGGTLLTAALTDVEILARYIFNLIAPVNLSLAYLVEPIVSLADSRLYLYGLALAALVTTTIYFAANRRRAVFGWLWFVGALGPNLNLIAITHLMQDRYVYLSTPGFFLAVAEMCLGLSARLAARPGGEPAPRLRQLALLAALYVVVLNTAGIMRGAVFSNMYELFNDAVQKQPRAAHARHGLGVAYGHIYDVMAKSLPASTEQERQIRDRALKELHDKMFEQSRAFVEDCPDRYRQVNYAATALAGGTYLELYGDFAGAERFYRLGTFPPANVLLLPDTKAEGFARLAGLKLLQEKLDEASEFARKSLELDNGNHLALFVRGASNLARANALRASPDAYREVLKQARDDLQSIPNGAESYNRAQELLRRMMDEAAKE